MKKTLLLAALLAVSASAASAAGLNFGWGECGAGVSTANKNFACNTNTLSAQAIGSFVAPAGTTAITGEEIVIDLQSASAVLPAWWQFKTTGTCRATAYSMSSDMSATTATTCADYWGTQASGALTAFNPNIIPGQTNRARVLGVFAVAPSAAGPVDADVEYFGFAFKFTGAKTVGAGLCAGCADPVCLVLNEIKLTQPVGVGNYRIQNAAVRNYVTWQGGAIGVGGCPAVVPARNTTWGQVKSLYR